MANFRSHRRGLVLMLASACPALEWFQNGVTAPEASLPASENLSYNIEWRLITAGKAHLSWSTLGASGFKTDLHLESAGLVSKLFKVDDEYTSTLDEGLCAHSSFMKTHEGSRQRETKIAFDRERRKASYLERDMVK